MKKITGTHVHHCKASEFATAVFAPRVVPGLSGVFHGPDGIYGLLPFFADPLTGNKVFKVPAGEAEYTLTTSARRSARVQAASTRIDASWTFHSKAPSSGLPTELPVSTVRFAPKTGPDSRVEAGRTVAYPVTVEGAARGQNLKSLTVYVSYDDGRTWKKTDVRSGKITVKRGPAGQVPPGLRPLGGQRCRVRTPGRYGSFS